MIGGSPLDGKAAWLDTDSVQSVKKNPNAEGEIIDGKFVRTHGVSWITTGLFVLGDMAGSGVVALPTAVQQCGLIFGLFITAVMGLITASTAVFLGWSWDVLILNWDEYRSHCRKPYAEMGYRAFGEKMRTAVSVVLNITQFGTSVVLLLLATKNLTDLLKSITPNGPGLCIMILIVAAVLTPLTWLKSPEEFWWAIVGAMCTTFIAVCLMVTGALLDSADCTPEKENPPFSILNLFVALGTILFTFGGHAAFPTLQHDMRRPQEFQKSAIMAFIIASLFYAPVVLGAAISYGDSLRESIIPSIQTGWIQKAVNLMIAFHCMLTVVLVINPLNQEAEEYLDFPQEFGKKRVILRTAIMFVLVLVAESVPNFGPVLNLMGASTFTMMCVIFPCVFYVFLSARHKRIQLTGKDEGPPTIADVLELSDRRVLVICSTIVVVGFVCGAAGTFSALLEITSTHFEIPCYVRAFMNIVEKAPGASTVCCGHYQNITVGGRNPEGFCIEPNLNFYSGSL